MTREEAKIDIITISRFGAGMHSAMILESKIDEIYDDFESRTCENCRDFNGTYCINEELVNVFEGFYDHENFGCNKFERKTD